MTQMAKAYARGLYDLAKEEALTETILQQLTALQTAFFQEPLYCSLLSARNLRKEERLSVLDKSFRGKLHPYVLNFLKLLTQKGHIGYFLDCCTEYRIRYNAENRILPVCAVTAVPLTPAQTKKLTEKLTAITGKTVELTNKVDPACLGGVCLDYDGKRLDGTVKNQLDNLAKVLGG